MLYTAELYTAEFQYLLIIMRLVRQDDDDKVVFIINNAITMSH